MNKKIDPKRFYSLYEIVGLSLIPGVENIPTASRLVKFDKETTKILKAAKVARGLRGVQYKVKGENIIKYLAHMDAEKGRS